MVKLARGRFALSLLVNLLIPLGAVLLISEDLDEIIELSDRIMVLYEGKCMGIVSPDTPVENIGLMMTGSSLA